MTVHALDLINGHLCRCIHGANHHMDNGYSKFEMKDVIWVSLNTLYTSKITELKDTATRLTNH